MAFLGLSGDALTFLGGVATGASKEIDKQMERQQEAIKEASSTAIRARLAGRKKYDTNVADITKQIKPLLAQYNINDVASLMQMPLTERNKVISSLASLAGKTERGTLFKALKEFDGKTSLTSSQLINSLVPAYKESKMDYSGLIPNTAVDVLFGFNPEDRLQKRVTAGVGGLKETTPGVDLSAYGKGLNEPGKIRVFSKEPGDVTSTSKTFSNTLFNSLGGKTTLYADGSYRDEGGQDGDRELSNRFSLTLGNIYAKRVRTLQITETLSLEEAEAQAKLDIQSYLSKSFTISDPASNRKTMLEFTKSTMKQGMNPNQGYGELIKGDKKPTTIVSIDFLEKEIQGRDRNNEAITTKVKEEYLGKVDKILRSQGIYSEPEIDKIIALFLARIKELLRDE
tara:strand:+ start:1637 stop:2830 length:1194 start_codon:yes stop_codon:yes gene_type:complete